VQRTVKCGDPPGIRQIDRPARDQILKLVLKVSGAAGLTLRGKDLLAKTHDLLIVQQRLLLGEGRERLVGTLTINVVDLLLVKLLVDEDGLRSITAK